MSAKIKLNAASGGGSVSLKAPSTTTSNAAVELQLPVADGSASQFIKTDGSGNLAFASETADFVKLQSVDNPADGADISSIQFTNLDTATYKAFRLVFSILPVTDGVELYFRFMNGSSVRDPSNYLWSFIGVASDSSTYEQAGYDTNYVKFSATGGNSTSEGYRFIADIVPQTTNDFTQANNFLTWTGIRRDTSNNFRTEQGGAQFEDDGDTDGFQIYPTSGNINKYSYTLYGVKR